MIQSINPVINTISISNDTPSAFFSLMVFITCGNKDVAVHIPAANPMICVHSMKPGLQIPGHRIKIVVPAFLRFFYGSFVRSLFKMIFILDHQDQFPRHIQLLFQVFQMRVPCYSTAHGGKICELIPFFGIFIYCF